MTLIANIAVSHNDVSVAVSHSLLEDSQLSTPAQSQKSNKQKDQQSIQEKEHSQELQKRRYQQQRALIKQQQQQQQQEEEEPDLFTQIGSFLKSLIFSEPSPILQPILASKPVDNWQANYLSPVHTKLKKEGKIPSPEKERGVDWLLKNHFKGVLPYYRVWEIKMEEMDSDPICVGRGTPPRPNRPIFNREMEATKLFLKDYGKRRGLISQSKNANEEAVEVKSLRRSSTDSNQGAKPFSNLRSQSQTLAPEQLIKRKKSVNSAHRASSKLIS